MFSIKKKQKQKNNKIIKQWLQYFYFKHLKSNNSEEFLANVH